MATQTLTENAPKIEPIKWISIEEAEKLERYIGKSYIPKDDEKFAKRYYYKVEAIIPYTPADSYAPADQSRYKFLLQKYDRKRTETVSIATDKGDSQDVERNVRVEANELRNGTWVCIDPYANRLIDTEEFKKGFKLDDVAD